VEQLYDGDVVRVTTTFTGEDLTTPSDPTVAKLAYRTSYNGPTSTLTWDGSTSAPSIGRLARIGSGTYEAWLDTTGLVGVWSCQGQSTGVNQAASKPVQFEVLCSL
jgi:hypothetical protein